MRPPPTCPVPPSCSLRLRPTAAPCYSSQRNAGISGLIQGEIPNSRISKLNEEQRAQLSKRLDKMSKELDGKLVQELDTYLQRPTFYNDKGNVNRVLNFCRVPKGERREKLIWRSSLSIFFVTSWAIGQWGASRCMQYHYEYQKKQGEETANHAV